MGTMQPSGSCVYIRKSTSARGITNMFYFAYTNSSVLLIFSPTITDFWLKFYPTITACLIREDHNITSKKSDSVHSYWWAISQV